MLGFDSELGYLVIGEHVPPGGAPSLRAISLAYGAVAWESLHGLEELRTAPWLQVVGSQVLVGARHVLFSLDLRTGQVEWQTRLPERIDPHLLAGAMRPPIALESGNVLVVKTHNGAILTLDRSSGEERSRSLHEPSTQALLTADPDPVVLARSEVRGRGVLAMLTPPTLARRTSLGKKWFSDEANVRALRLSGRVLAAEVDDWGLLGASGVVAVDVATGSELLFARAKHIDPDLLPLFADGRLYFATRKGGVQRLHSEPGGRPIAPPIDGEIIVALERTGALVLAVSQAPHGETTRLLGLDPTTLQLCGDCGQLAPRPAGPGAPHDPSRYLATQGTWVFFVCLREPHGQAVLRAVDMTMASLVWESPLEPGEQVQDLYAAGGGLVLVTGSELRIHDLAQGAVLARYAQRP